MHNGKQTIADGIFKTRTARPPPVERLNTVVLLKAKRTLERLASCYGVTQRTILEKPWRESNASFSSNRSFGAWRMITTISD